MGPQYRKSQHHPQKSGRSGFLLQPLIKTTGLYVQGPPTAQTPNHRGPSSGACMSIMGQQEHTSMTRRGAHRAGSQEWGVRVYAYSRPCTCLWAHAQSPGWGHSHVPTHVLTEAHAATTATGTNYPRRHMPAHRSHRRANYARGTDLRRTARKAHGEWCRGADPQTMCTERTHTHTPRHTRKCTPRTTLSMGRTKKTRCPRTHT